MAPRTIDRRRRRLLQALALAPASAAAPAVWAQAAEDSAALIAANVCMLAPETTAGPFYLDPALVRSDITEGRPGAPMVLALQVVTADCVGVEGARVDLWHCDAGGNYSGFARQGTTDTAGQTFLRGTQFTRRGGVARFHTIYPGWYGGRTTHLHYKVILGDRSTLTSQIFLPDAVSERVYATATPYRSRAGERRVFNDNDAIAVRAGAGAFAAIRQRPEGYAAALVVGIDARAS
jgi:protocatechuate 3,4-dioxygenase beta subunit